MISVKTILLFVSAAPLAVYSLDCDDFTVGDCNESKDGLIESNDRVSLLTERRIYTGSLTFSIFRFQQKKLICQSTCEILAECAFFYFQTFDDGTFLCEHYT